MDEIEVTDAMLAAGERTMLQLGIPASKTRAGIIYRAMAAAAPRRDASEELRRLTNRMANVMSLSAGNIEYLRDMLIDFAAEIERRARGPK